LPNYNLFQDHISYLCIGTDSLASNGSLDLISEANVILSHSKNFTLENVLQLLTLNGAEALNITENFGQLLIGKNTGLNLVEVKNDQLKFIKKLT
jgi:cytosine/adenosine deaminase-related metal-dependent hydrolase